MAQKRGAGWDEQDIPVIPPGKNHLLAIGINDYAHCPKLHNAVKDVEDFAALMGDKYGFEKAQIQLLCNEDATAERIMAAFKSLVRTVQPTDNVLIYFSGHGELDDILDEGFWIPIEAERGKENHYIRNSTIHNVLRKINSFHTFLIVDSCYSGSLFLDGKSKFVSDAYDFASRWGLTSGRNTIVSDGKPGTNSPFATALLDTLRRIDQPMNVSALCDIIKQTVPAATKKLQTPIGDPLSIEGHKGGQFIFSPKVVVSPELSDWEKTKTENTESEEVSWKETIDKNTLLAYHRYLRKYPKGKYSEKADEQLEELENHKSNQTEHDVGENRKRRLPVEPEMVFVEGGVFQMAENYKVSLSDFSIGKYPIKQAEWKAVMGNNPSHFKEYVKCPVENVRWDDVQVFLKILNENTGKKYRMPTEAEWEFAARGSNQSNGLAYSGNNNIDKVAWYMGNSCSQLHPVGAKKANEIGIHDMSGNVWEWCSDWYGSYKNTGEVVVNPTGSDKGSDRVLRGGSWNDPSEWCRVSYRRGYIPDNRSPIIGFRVALSPK
jgi:sulfatase modifying factor 1